MKKLRLGAVLFGALLVSVVLIAAGTGTLLGINRHQQFRPEWRIGFLRLGCNDC